MSTKRKRKRKAEPAEPRSFPLALGWVVSGALVPRLLLPLFALAALIALGPETSRPDLAAVAAIALGASLALVIAINVPSYLRTLRSDRNIELRADELHIPVLKLFQLRPWDIKLADLQAIMITRKSGSSSKLELVLRDGRIHRFGAEVVQDRYALISAVERRIGNPR